MTAKATSRKTDVTAPASQSSSSIRNPLHFCTAFISLRKGFNADFQAEELEEGLLPALLNPFKRRFGTYRNLLN